MCVCVVVVGSGEKITIFPLNRTQFLSTVSLSVRDPELIHAILKTPCNHFQKYNIRWQSCEGVDDWGVGVGGGGKRVVGKRGRLKNVSCLFR